MKASLKSLCKYPAATFLNVPIDMASPESEGGSLIREAGLYLGRCFPPNDSSDELQLRWEILTGLLESANPQDPFENRFVTLPGICFADAVALVETCDCGRLREQIWERQLE